jgi:bacterial/archaeal transporter family-2 protein
MSLQSLALTLVALLAGALISLQAPINADAAARLGHPLAGATLSFVVGTAALGLLVLLFVRQDVNVEALKSLPLYVLLGGGLLGAMYVTTNILLAPRIGIAAIMALGIAGQLFAALLLDRFGAFGLIERELTLGRVSGACMVLVGALMVRLL